MKESMMGCWAYGWHEEDKECIQNFDGETSRNGRMASRIQKNMRLSWLW
jgi:hypothetical protein